MTDTQDVRESDLPTESYEKYMFERYNISKDMFQTSVWFRRPS